jgi:radical SAM family uncharacterized protein/radical SAM-linked protein
MSPVQDILSHVEKPSRYLGTEVNAVRKDPNSVKLAIALAFPDLYEIGTSHFGIQILYHILNKEPEIAAERVFAPAADMEAVLRKQGVPLSTLESGRSLDDFDIIGFSLLYELNYTNVLNMLDLAGLPLKAEQRSASHPLIITGGPCVCNPEPMAAYFDAMVFGDGEAVILEMAKCWMEWRDHSTPTKKELLLQWSKLEGVYIPQFYRPRYDQRGFQHLEPMDGIPQHIHRAIVPDLENTSFPDRPIVPFGRPIHDRLRLEVSRGCSRGCRFCQAGMIYRPVRERSCDHLLSIAEQSLITTGYEDLSLLSLSTGDYTCLAGLMENLMGRTAGDRVAISLPSVRAGSLTPTLMDLIRKVRKTGFTIAPEAGSQRLRDVINKNITYDDVAATVRDAFALGWQVIKLYFMIGLPTETDGDVEAICDMVKRLKTIKGPQHRRGKINVSITTFIPKPHTPFQWASLMDMQTSRDKIDRIKHQLKLPGVRVKWQNPAMSCLEGAMARGDRRMAAVVEAAWRKGALFDGWTDRFDFGIWQEAFDEAGLDIGFFTVRNRQIDEPLPWAHMKSGVTNAFFKHQWKEALAGEPLSDCRYGECHQCGVCDFDGIAPRVHYSCPRPQVDDTDMSTLNEGPYHKLEVTYSKLDKARYFGHLEQAHIIARAFRRARIDVEFSRGFHPMPRISFDNPLPLGMESDAEKFFVSVDTRLGCEEMMKQLNRHLPTGLSIIACQPYVKTKKENPDTTSIDRYRVRLHHTDLVSQTAIDRFLDASSWPHTRHKSKGRVQTVDLKQWVHAIQWDQDRDLHLELICRQGKTVRPADFLAGVFDFDNNDLGNIRVRKLAP